jgi:hypothetical protein
VRRSVPISRGVVPDGLRAHRGRRPLHRPRPDAVVLAHGAALNEESCAPVVVNVTKARFKFPSRSAAYPQGDSIPENSLMTLPRDGILHVPLVLPDGRFYAHSVPVRRRRWAKSTSRIRDVSGGRKPPAVTSSGRSAMTVSSSEDRLVAESAQANCCARSDGRRAHGRTCEGPVGSWSR